MKHYDGLETLLFAELDLKSGTSESEESFMSRAVYSFAARTGSAALWDKIDESYTTSIVHFKDRVHEAFENYMSVYPEVSSVFSRTKNEAVDEIYKIFGRTGMYYSSPRHISPPRPTAMRSDDICLTRGGPIGAKQSISGAGTFCGSKCDLSGYTTVSVSEMFGISDTSIGEVWDDVVKNADMREKVFECEVEYLLTEPPYNRGYWSNIPDKSGQISIVRTIDRDTYYLYKFIDDRMLVCQLPGWMTLNGEYRLLAAGCLKSRSALPPIRYRYDGGIVLVKQEYLLPPTELYLLKLYSWQDTWGKFPRDFTRVVDSRAFAALKKIYEEIGYEFKEEEHI